MRYLTTTVLLLSSAPHVFAQLSQTTVGSQRPAFMSRPTVSPYLAMVDVSGTGFDYSRNYFTSVLPRFNDTAAQQRSQQAIYQAQRAAASMRSAAAQRAQSPARTTGHPSRFSNYLQYYPGFRR